MTSKAEKQAKAQETHLGALLNQYMYAVIEDHNSKSDRINLVKSIMYQTHVNLMRASDDPKKSTNVENRFNIQTEPKQHLAYIFRCFINEISALTLTDDAKIVDIIAALKEEYDDESIGAMFLHMGVTFEHEFGTVLKGSTDESNWIHQQLVGALPALKTNLRLIAEIATGFNQALRAAAWLLGRSVWFGAEKTISSTVFIYTIALPTSYKLALNKFDEILDNVRVKAVRPKGKSKTVSGTTQVSSEPTVSTTVSTTVNTDSEPTTSENTSLKSSQVLSTPADSGELYELALAGI